MSKVKCRQCGKQLVKNDAIEIKPRLFACCEECKNKYVESHKENKKETPNEYAPLRQLTDYVQTYAPETEWVRFVAMVKKMCFEYNMTIPGIHFTLQYVREHEERSLQGDGLGSVPFWYDKARKWYSWKQQMKQNVREWKNVPGASVIVKNKEEDAFT